MFLSILKEAFIIWGVVFGIMYICINIKRGFYYLGDSGNYVYVYVCFNIFLGVVFGDVFLFIPKGTLAGLGGLFE